MLLMWQILNLCPLFIYPIQPNLQSYSFQKHLLIHIWNEHTIVKVYENISQNNTINGLETIAFGMNIYYGRIHHKGSI